MKFNIITSLIGIVCLGTTLTSCNISGIKASDNIISKNITVSSPITELNVSGSIKVSYAYGDNAVRIEGPDNIVPLVKVDVINGKANISYKENVSIIFNNDKKLMVYVTSQHLSSANLSGSGDIYITSELTEPQFNLELKGSGDINTQGINCSDSFKCYLGGSGDIDVKGSVYAMNSELQLDGSGDVKVNTLISPQSKVTVSGSGDLVLKNIKGNQIISALNGSGDLKLYNIECEDLYAELNGSGDLKLHGRAVNGVYKLNNSGSIDAYDVQAQNVSASTNGSGSISCNAIQSLKSDIKGSGEINYKGNPQVQSTGNHAPRSK